MIESASLICYLFRVKKIESSIGVENDLNGRKYTKSKGSIHDVGFGGVSITPLLMYNLQNKIGWLSAAIVVLSIFIVFIIVIMPCDLNACAKFTLAKNKPVNVLREFQEQTQR